LADRKVIDGRKKEKEKESLTLSKIYPGHEILLGKKVYFVLLESFLSRCSATAPFFGHNYPSQKAHPKPVFNYSFLFLV
jgi:hypothetical protein